MVERVEKGDSTCTMRQCRAYRTDGLRGRADRVDRPLEGPSFTCHRGTVQHSGRQGGADGWQVVPDELKQKAILKLYDIADRAAGQEDICRKMGVDDLARLRDWPLDQRRRLPKRSAKGPWEFVLPQEPSRAPAGRWPSRRMFPSCSPWPCGPSSRSRPLLWLSPPRPWWQGARPGHLDRGPTDRITRAEKADSSRSA